ncbi:DinB family protein [Streptomyces sp. NPDC058257]|uniref:DinB family protein n=1 Tax=Streptomyces sp. NPDC058257 TaxID=3346409 RepID=UPI0036F037DF
MTTTPTPEPKQGATLPVDPARRAQPSLTADERASIEGWLDYHRATLLSKCAGLGDEQLRRTPVASSSLSLMGLVRHLSENERYWFRVIASGEDLPEIYCTEEEPERDFNPAKDDTWAEAEETWQAEIAAARVATAEFGLDDLSVGKSLHRGAHFNMRWIYTHMIEEYARHNGHADLVRELVDGATGD